MKRSSIKNKITNIINDDDFKEHLAGYIFISPWLIGFFSFLVIPMALSLFFSFTQYNFLSSPIWIGLRNFRDIFNDQRFFNSLKVTFIYAITAVPLRLVFALFLAVLFSKQRKLVGLYRTVFYLPSVIGASVAVSVLWRQLFGMRGALNSILISFGILNEPIGWLYNPRTAMASLVLLAAWQFGSPMLIFIAGLKQIPESFYEAASIDGAGKWKKFIKITLPMLSPVIFFNLIMQTIACFLMFTQAYIITEGGPYDTTMMYILYMYRRAFGYYEMGYASALAWILLVIIAIITFFIFKSSSAWVYYESKGEL